MYLSIYLGLKVSTSEQCSYLCK